MKGGTLVHILLVALAPIVVLTLIVTSVVSPGLFVKWEPPMTWSTEFGNATLDAENGVRAMSLDNDGLYVGGFVDKNPPTSLGNAFVSRFDLAGHHMWTRLFGNPMDFNIRSVSAGGNGFYVAVSGFVKKYDLSGNEIWTADISGADINEAQDVSVGDGGIYATGSQYFFSNSSFGEELHAYDFNGSTLWTTFIGGAYYADTKVYAGTTGVYVSVHPSTNSPASLSDYDFNGTLLWTRQLMCSCYPESVSGDATGIYVGGPSSGNEAFVSKYDQSGSQLWTRLDIATLPAVNFQLSANSSGLFVAIAGTDEGFIVRYDESGSRVWSFRISWLPYSILANQKVLYVGGNSGLISTDRDALLAEFSQSSSLILFGINPPLSFLLLGGLIGAPTMDILWLKRRKRRELQPVSTNS